MTIFFIVSFVISLFARILCGAFADEIAIFAKLLTPLTCVTVGFGIFAAIFVGIKIYKEIKNSKDK